MKTIPGFFVLLALMLCSLGALGSEKNPPANKYLVFVGTYTKGESKGIYAYRFDGRSGEINSLGLAAEAVDPSFLAVDPSRRFLYAVNELSKYKDAASGAVSAFAIDRHTGKLSPLNEVPSGGADPCYIAFDRTGKYVLVANYTGGNVSVFPVRKDGRLGDASAFVQHAGAGANPERQEGPHAHWIETTADNRFAVAADLGLDQLLVYHFDGAKGSLTPNSPPFAKVDAGSGPRHLSFHPNGRFAYVINELKSTITGLSYDAGNGVLHPLQTISTLPPGFAGSNNTAEIHVHPSGKFLFASNRGHDSIAVFSIDKNTGRLDLVDHFSTRGKTPRTFEIDPGGSRLFVANEDSGNVVIFRIDPETGRLTSTGHVLHVPSPVCLKFVAAD
jgi:6-phosphogluconolactonase